MVRFPARSVLQISFQIFVIGFAIAASAMPNPKPDTVVPGKISSPISGGALHGGQAAEEFSLLNVELRTSGNGAERIILSYGDRRGLPSRGEPGFFHAVLDRSGKRMSIDLAQVTKTAVDPVQLRKVLSRSPLVASSQMTMDPLDGSTNISLLLKVPVQLSMSTEAGSQSKILVDMKPLPGSGVVR